LNDNAATLFGAPADGLRTQSEKLADIEARDLVQMSRVAESMPGVRAR